MYEISFILKEENPTPVQKVFSARGVEVEGGEELRKIRLAYPMKKHDYGFFGSFKFEATPEILEKVFADLKLEEGIFRYMVTKSQGKKVEAKESRNASEAPVLQSKKTEESKHRPDPVLTNEELEKKIEEILK